MTFNTVEAAQACIEAGRAGHKYYQGFGPLEMRAAPEAEDVIWENLQCSRWERGFRSLVALLAALAAVTASTAAITYSSLQQTSLMRQFVTGEEGAPTFYELVYNYVGFLALLIFGYVSIFALVPLLAHKVERFHTFAAREMNICFKLSFFQVRA